MSVPRWWVFPCNVERGNDDNDKPQTYSDCRHEHYDSWPSAYAAARKFSNECGYDFAALMELIEGKGLVLNCTFGYRPAKHEYDFPGPRADGWLLVKKWCEAVLAKVESTSIKE